MPPPPNGQQPSQQIVPQHTGLKALYWRTQNLAPQPQQPQLWGNKPKVQPANDGTAAKPDTARASRAEEKSFFMVVGIS
jgi:hypothetical protein